MDVDMGAYELGNVHLKITGSAVPGGTLILETTGRPGLVVILCVAAVPGEVLLPPYGALFFDLASSWVALPFLVIPGSGSALVEMTIPFDLQVPVSLVVQEIAINVFSFRGNVSNDVPLTITTG
jgi:hypothetical protein